jgi:hypothetical protein
MTCTIDFGLKTRLYSFRLYGQTNYWYNNYGFREFEVWATDALKTGQPDSYWIGEGWKADWEKLGDYEVKRASGEEGPTSSPSQVDKDAAIAGWLFLVPTSAKPARYVRFVVRSVWGTGKKGLAMAEVIFMGGNDGSY